MINEVALLKGLVKKERERLTRAEEHVIKGRCFRPEESAETLNPLGGLKEKSGVQQRKVQRRGTN